MACVDVLVNNAGRGAIGAAEETSDGELRDLMDLHFFGPAALTRAVLPGMRERGTGALLVCKCIPAYDDQIEPLRTGMPDVEAADFAVTSSRSPAGGPDVQRFPEHPRVHLRPRWVNLEMLWGKR